MQPTDPPDPTRAGQTGSTPFIPPPPSAPPPEAAPAPSLLAAPSRATTRVAVTRRILWVGTAAYPLATIARVSTTVIVPEKAAAVRRFLKFTAIVGLAALGALMIMSLGGSSRSYDSDGNSGPGWVIGVASMLVVFYFLIATLPVLVQPRLHALTVDTAGPPTALLAWQSPEPAHTLQATITQAIENPQIEFQQYVSSVVVDLRHYQFGDSVNIYGGQGHTGVSK